MAKYLKMPKLSDTMTEGVIAKWKKNEGDEIHYGEEIADIETDKATMAWEAPGDGIVYRIYVPEGQSAPLGTPLVLILGEGEEPPADADNPPGPETKSPTHSQTDAQDKNRPGTAASPKKSTPETNRLPPPATVGDARIKASPLARKLAEEQGLDLSRIRGTGPGGRITSEDLAYSQGGGGSGTGINLLPNLQNRSDREIELNGMRRVIAERLLESKSSIPHFYLNIQIDAEPLMTLRSQVNEASLANSDQKYSINDFVVRAVVLAACEVPEVNASFAGDKIYQFSSINLAVAVAVENGLVTPVVKSAETKSILELSQEIKDLAKRARDRKLTPEEMQGGTITVSNLGAYGIHSFDAIINPPQSAILSIGTITKEPVVSESNQIVPGQRMWIGMSCDHRVIDGAVGATYLSALRRYLETPVLLIS